MSQHHQASVQHKGTASARACVSKSSQQQSCATEPCTTTFQHWAAGTGHGILGRGQRALGSRGHWAGGSSGHWALGRSGHWAAGGIGQGAAAGTGQQRALGRVSEHWAAEGTGHRRDEKPVSPTPLLSSLNRTGAVSPDTERSYHFHSQWTSFQLQKAQLSVQICFNKTSTLDDTCRLSKPERPPPRRWWLHFPSTR